METEVGAGLGVARVAERHRQQVRSRRDLGKLAAQHDAPGTTVQRHRPPKPGVGPTHFPYLDRHIPPIGHAERPDIHLQAERVPRCEPVGSHHSGDGQVWTAGAGKQLHSGPRQQIRWDLGQVLHLTVGEQPDRPGGGGRGSECAGDKGAAA